jgi:hypothetical protein
MQHSSNAQLLTHAGSTDSITGWASRLGLSVVTLWARLHTYKWSVAKAIETPVSRSRKASVATGVVGWQSTEYEIWRGILARCTNESHKAYPEYGGRGIGVPATWGTLDAFLADVGPCPSDQHSLDRRDNDASYSRENCRWVLRTTQSNNRRNVHSRLGVNATVAAKAAGLAARTIRMRITDCGWCKECAFTQPRNGTCSHKGN